MAVLDIHPCILKWIHSFLLDRQRRVKIGNHYPDWITLTGGMPQGTWFGPYVLLILIDDSKTIMATFKFVDDVTLTKLIDQSNISQMQLVADQIADWSRRNFMNISTKKTKEMLFGPITENPPPQVTFNTSHCQLRRNCSNQFATQFYVILLNALCVYNVQQINTYSRSCSLFVLD